MSEGLFQKEQAICFCMLGVLTVMSMITTAIPIQINITLHSICIIGIGSFKSLEELLRQIKVVHIDKSGKASGIEKMSFEDAWQFPIVAGCTLCGMYFAMQYFGEESVNYFILAYIGLGSVSGIKMLVKAFTNALNEYDKDFLVDFNISMIGLEVQITLADIICLPICAANMFAYVYFKSWVFNNFLCLIFCINALQSMFLGNFKNGFMLLVLLFFYDIFFVFGTDVMLTVAKGIDAPIKLQFPKEWVEGDEKPKYSILGLGDIVIPGVFVSLCLRFDFLKTINIGKLEKLIKEQNGAMEYLVQLATTCSRNYFNAVNLGYIIAMVCTTVVMLVFNHGQPALLYLVPGCILSVLGVAFSKGEYKELMEFDEEAYLTRDDEDEDDKKDN